MNFQICYKNFLNTKTAKNDIRKQFFDIVLSFKGSEKLFLFKENVLLHPEPFWLNIGTTGRQVISLI